MLFFVAPLSSMNDKLFLGVALDKSHNGFYLQEALQPLQMQVVKNNIAGKTNQCCSGDKTWPLARQNITFILYVKLSVCFFFREIL